MLVETFDRTQQLTYAQIRLRHNVLRLIGNCQFPIDYTCVGLQGTGQQLHESGLTRSIATDNAQHLPLTDLARSCREGEVTTLLFQFGPTDQRFRVPAGPWRVRQEFDTVVAQPHIFLAQLAIKPAIDAVPYTQWLRDYAVSVRFAVEQV